MNFIVLFSILYVFFALTLAFHYYGLPWLYNLGAPKIPLYVNQSTSVTQECVGTIHFLRCA